MSPGRVHKLWHYVAGEVHNAVGHFVLRTFCLLTVIVIICETYFLFVCIQSWWVVGRSDRQTTGLWVFGMYLWWVFVIYFEWVFIQYLSLFVPQVGELWAGERGRLRNYVYFVCICDKYLYFIFNEYFFSICHYFWEVHTSSLFVSQVGGLWAGVRGRLRNYEYFVCFCDKYLYFILNEYFFSICHYLYPKLVGCGQVWEADCGIMRRSALATLEAPNKCTYFYSFYFMNLVIDLLC